MLIYYNACDFEHLIVEISWKNLPLFITFQAGGHDKL